MPPITPNTTDPLRDEPDDAGWANWEQTFRDNRPVLPEAAMARIEAAMQREAAKPVKPPLMMRLRGRIALLILTIVLINLMVLWAMMHDWHAGKAPRGPATPFATTGVEDRFSIDVPIGPPLAAPDRPILALAENAGLFATGDKPSAPGDAPMIPLAPAPIPAPALVSGAEKYCARATDGWRLLGLVEIRRSAGVAVPLPQVFPPHADDFHSAAAWRMLPVNETNVGDFADQSRRIQVNTQMAPGGNFWHSAYEILLADYQKKPPALLDAQRVAYPPSDLPSKLADQARFDLLVELGEPQAQAALDVLTTRSYRSLAAFNEPRLARGANFKDGSHDLVDRLFAMKLDNDAAGAQRLLAKARSIRYLNDPQDLAVLLARLGPADAWEKLLQPLMKNEVAFIENPPAFGQTPARVAMDALVSAAGKTSKDGVSTYDGASVSVSVGPWKIVSSQLSVYRNAERGVLLTGVAPVRVQGVIGLLGATADSFTFNTETGELKLSGHVRLDGWTAVRDLASCTITRVGEVRDEK